MKKHVFISFEGMDGCGKDSMLFALTQAIRSENNTIIGDKYSRIWITREPTRLTEPGKKIARLIRERDVTETEASDLFIADRKAHSRIIEQQLDHSHVLVSRYDLSTLSYQLGGEKTFEDLYAQHEYLSSNGALIPDLTLVFDLPATVAMKRLEGRSEIVECFENLEFQKKVRNNLTYCVDRLRAKDGRTIVFVNANQAIEKVTEEMIQAVRTCFPQEIV